MTSDFPLQASVTAAFADDFNLAESAPDLPTITKALNDDLLLVEAWADRKNLVIAPSKSSVTLFTPDPAQYKFHPQVFYKGTLLPLNQKPKNLGCNLDPQLIYSNHTSIQAPRASGREQIMKAVCGSTWGQDKETLLTTYKGLVRPLIEYAVAIWQPNVSPTSILRLQRVQNSALRTATGCHMRTSIDHLHAECKILKVDQHIDLLASQFLANALTPDHPSHGVVTLPLGPRSKKHTLYSKNIAAVSPYLRDGIIPPSNYKKVVSSLHTAAVSAALRASAPNKLLGVHPPDINPEEETLSRPHRCVLTQLRADECHRLKSYMHAIGKSTDDLCPECGLTSQSVSHLFECPSFPTVLTIRDLWSHPWDSAVFISSLPSFVGHLPPVVPLPPLPIPPEPPP